jgi:predicted enzyme related to lactoylglutathione lyase
MSMGRFVWYDLLTPDPDASKKFLSELLGVEAKPSEEYSELSVNGVFFGGLMKKPESAWLGYVQVEDLARSTTKAEELGARAIMSGLEIPDVGSFSFLQDPQGAMLYLFQSSKPLPEPPSPLPQGLPCWAELHTTDPAASKQFYGQLFGWTANEVAMEGFQYTMLRLGDKDVAGMTPAQQRSGWLFYFLVADADEFADQAVKLGAKLVAGPNGIPGMGRMAVLAEPGGAMFALWAPTKASVHSG